MEEYIRCLREILLNDEETMIRQVNIFDDLCGEDRVVILYGAGNVGRKLAREMYKDKKSWENKLFFTDQRAELWGSYIEGVPVLSLDDAIKAHGDSALFVITVFNREPDCSYPRIASALKIKGADQCIPWALAAWKYKETMLPHFYLGCAANIFPHKEHIYKAFCSLMDARSQQIFIELLQASLTAPFETISHSEHGPQYLVPEVLKRLPPQITFADCGAYDGDVLRDVLLHIGADRIREYHAFEPDPANFRLLEGFVSTLPVDVRQRIICHNAAVGSKAGFVSMAETGSESSHVCGSANSSEGIACVTLDAVFTGKTVDFIKMDIEGFEKEALTGAAACIRVPSCIVAASAYHRPDDFFAIPAFLMHLRRGQGIFRKHCANLFDTVYYHF